MKSWIAGFIALAVIVVAAIAGEAGFGAAARSLAAPRQFKLTLPLPDDVLSRFGLSEHTPLDIDHAVLSGFFSDWSPDDPAFRMERKAFDRWEIRAAMSPGKNQYKFVIHLKEPVTDTITGIPTSVIWAQDRSNPVRTDDGFGGFNSVVTVPPVDEWRFYFRLVLAAAAALIVLTLLLDLAAKFAMGLSLPLTARLALSVVLTVAVSDSFLVASRIHSDRQALRDSYVDLMNLMHQSLLSQGLNPEAALKDKVAREKLQGALSKLLERSVARVETRKLSTQQITLTTVAVLDRDFRPLAVAGSPAAMRQFATEAATRGFADAADYFAKGVLHDLLADARSDKFLPGRIEFGSTPPSSMKMRAKDEQAAMFWAGSDLLLYPAGPSGKPSFWYAARYHPEISGNRLRGAFLFDLLVVLLSLVLTVLVLFTVSRYLSPETAKPRMRQQALPENDNLAGEVSRMKASIEDHVHNLKLINVIETCLTGIRDPDELYQVFLTFLTANFGFHYNRGAIFMLTEGKLEGRYAVGMLDMDELTATFGSYDNYRALKIDINSFLENPASFLSRTNNRFTSSVREISVSADDESAVLDAIWTRKPVLVPARDDDPKPMDRILRRRLNLGEYAVLPLHASGKAVAALLVDNRFDNRPLTEELVEELQILTNEFSLHLQNLAEAQAHETVLLGKEKEVIESREREQDAVRRMDGLVRDLHDAESALKQRDDKALTELRWAKLAQENWLNRAIPAASSLGVSAVCVPAREVSGDFFDARRTPDGKLRVMIARLPFSGAPAEAMRAAVLAIWDKADGKSSPGEALRDWNQRIVEAFPASGIFFAASVIDIDRSRKECVYSNAGGNLLFQLSGGAAVPLQKRGKVVGAAEGVRYLDETIVWETEFRLLMATEGLSLSANAAGQAYDLSRIQNAAASSKGFSVQKTMDLVLEDWKVWTEDSQNRENLCILGIEV